VKGNKISDEYEEIERFDKGYAPVRNGEKKGLINTSGKLVVPLLYNLIFMQYTDIAEVGITRPSDQLDQVGLINLKNSQMFVPPIYEFISLGEDNIALVKTHDGKTGYINFSGKIIFQPRKLELANGFSDGLAEIKDEKGTFFIDKSGKQVQDRYHGQQ